MSPFLKFVIPSGLKSEYQSRFKISEGTIVRLIPYNHFLQFKLNIGKMTTANQSVPSFSVLPARPEHAAKIRGLILRSGINPTGLNWERFSVALTPDGDFVGCGQIKPHIGGVMELASVAVEPAWRGRGVGRAIIQALVDSHPGELHLMCQSNLGPLYEKFGFHIISEVEMPTYFRRVSKLAGVLANLAKASERLLVMRRPQNNP